MKDPTQTVLMLIAVFVSIGFHEFAHAKMADMAGDPTPRLQGRVTLNVFKHLDPVGSMMIILSSLAGFGFGWGKPVMVDPRKMRNPRWDDFWCAAAGPISNLIQALVYAIVLRLLIMFHVPIGGAIGDFLAIAMIVNLSLMTFNLLPLGPLDGHWIIGHLLPSHTARAKWFFFNARYGGLILLAMVFFGQNLIGAILGPVITGMLRFMLGR